MSKVPRLVFIVCVAAFFSSNVFAINAYFYIRNYTSKPIKVNAVDDGDCVYWSTPSHKTILPEHFVLFEVAFNSFFFSKCGFEHSSQSFTITVELPNGKAFSTTIKWYKGYGRKPEIRTSDIKKSIPISIDLARAIYAGLNIPLVMVKEH